MAVRGELADVVVVEVFPMSGVNSGDLAAVFVARRNLHDCRN